MNMKVLLPTGLKQHTPTPPPEKRFLIRISYLLLCTACGLPIASRAQGAGAANAGAFTPVMRERLGLPAGFEPAFQPIATGIDRKYTEAEAKLNALNILAFEGCHVGGQRLLFRVTFARLMPFAGRTFILYADLDNNLKTGRPDGDNVGVDVMVAIHGDDLALSSHNPAFTDRNTLARGIVAGNVLYLTVDAPLLTVGGKVAGRVYLLSERTGGRSDSTRHLRVELPRSDLQVPPLEAGRQTSFRPLDDYRYHDPYVVLEKLSDKGLAAEDVTPKEPIKIGRPVPLPTFATTGRQSGKAGSVGRQQVRVGLLEEAGVARTATPVSFGFPLPKGAVFDPDQVRMLATPDRELPAQCTATAFWPDDSLKWVLVDCAAALQARESGEVIVEFGNEVKRAVAPSPLRVSEEAATLTVVTGPLQVVLDKARFNLFKSVARDANGDGKFTAGEQVAASAPEGVRLVDEGGRAFALSGIAPQSVRIEERGPQKVVVRVEGKYAAADGETYMRYVARLTFRAGSSRVTVAFTHVDDYLKTEFADLTSLTLALVPAGGVQQAAVFLSDVDGKLEAHEGQRLSLFQSDEKTCALKAGDSTVVAEKAPGVLRCTGSGGAITAVAHEFWQRWPKGLSADAGQITLSLLPELPGPEYGKGLPHYLLFPFVEGKYRFKWGMSFTTQVTFDFGDRLPPEELLADADVPVVAVVPAPWFAKTKALGPLAAPLEQQFAAWDKLVDRSYAGYLAERDQDRAYGYLNYGDWYGERERNWGNNEYDLAHGFFLQFARTGNRGYFRLAQTAARHQADVDCVHAYPDPYYVGANHLHSIGHTGMWSEQPEHGTWSWRYDYHTSAASGHVWADGMVDAWCLAGEPRVLESALALGEHIAWAMSRDFHELGTHERSAGWSLRAILAVYRQTYDPEYLAAAQRIAAVALKEQKLDPGGAWPHVLPGDHAGDYPGGVGNNLFLIGILLGGLQAYHEQSQDPAVLKSLESGVEWVLKSWDETAFGWPYSALVDGRPCSKPDPSRNGLIIGPLAYVAQATGNERLMGVVESALTGVVFGGGDTSGKSIAQKMFFTSGTLALLQQGYATHRPDRGVTVLDGSAASMVSWARATDADRHSARAPDRKVFGVELRAPAAELVAQRLPHGSMTKQAETGTLKVLSADGAVVKEGSFSTDGPHEFRCPLTGKTGAQFKVVIDDDQRGVWTLRGDKLGIVMQTVKDATIGGVGRAKYHFFVPAGTAEFRVKLLGVHRGTYGAMVLAPGNKPAGSHQDANEGPSFVRGAAKVAVPNPDAHPERGEIVVKPLAADTGKMWSLILWATIDLGCELEGVPPYLSLTEAAWFEPKWQP